MQGLLPTKHKYLKMLYSAFYFVQLTKTQLTFQHMVECVNNVERTGHRQLRIPLVLTQRDESLCLLPREGNVGRPQPHCPVRNKMRLRPRDGELEEIERGAGHRAGDGLLDQVQGPHLAKVRLQQQVEQRRLSHIGAAWAIENRKYIENIHRNSKEK